jgi:hypothetical protein
MKLSNFLTTIKNFCSQFTTVTDYSVKVKVNDALIDVSSIEYDYENKVLILIVE